MFAQYARLLNLLSKSDGSDVSEHMRAEQLKEVVHVFVESSDGSTTASSAVADNLVETLASAGKCMTHGSYCWCGWFYGGLDTFAVYVPTSLL